MKYGRPTPSPIWNRAVRVQNAVERRPSYAAAASAQQAARASAYLHRELEREPQIPQWMERAISVAKHHLEGAAAGVGIDPNPRVANGQVSVGAVWPWVLGGAAAVGAAGYGIYAYRCRSNVRRTISGTKTVNGVTQDYTIELKDRGCGADVRYAVSATFDAQGVKLELEEEFEDLQEAEDFFDRVERGEDPTRAANPGKACCSSCARGGPCSGGCGDKCTKGCPDHVRYRNHAPGDAQAHPHEGSFYARQNVYTSMRLSEALARQVTGTQVVPDWAEHKLHTASAMLTELAHRLNYLRHTGRGLMDHDGEPDRAP